MALGVRTACISFAAVLALFVATAVAAAPLPRAEPEDVGLSSERLERLERVMKAHVDEGRLAGTAMLIARRGKVAYFDTYGKADIEAGKPMRTDTIVRIYSMTKPVTSVAVMLLYEEGHFQLSDPVSKFLPEFKDLPVYESGEGDAMKARPASREATIRDLLTHTSGLSHGTLAAGPVADAYRKLGISPGTRAPKGARQVRTLAEMVTQLSKVPLANDPGMEWRYGVSVDVLGRLVEVISGMPLDEFFEARIFRPLKMKDTGFVVPPNKIKRFSANYSPGENGKAVLFDARKTSRYTEKPTLFSGGAGLVSTAEDYWRFCQMLLNGGDLDGVRLLGRKTVELMTADHLPREWPDIGPYPGSGFGLGFAVTRNVARSWTLGSVGNYGWGGFASTWFWIDPTEELIVVFMTQLLPASAYPLRGELNTLIYQAITD